MKNDKLVGEFLERSRALLQDVEEELLEIEEAGSEFDVGRVNKVYRATHLIKAGSGYLEFRTIRELAYALECVLEMLANRQLSPNEKLMDVLLSSFDLLQELLGDAFVHDKQKISGQIELLTSILTANLSPEQCAYVGEPQALPFEPSGVHFEVTRYDVFKIKKAGNFLYLLKYEFPFEKRTKDQNIFQLLQFLETSGCIVDCCASRGGGEQGVETVNVLYSSILELDLAKAILQIQDANITLLGLDETEEAAEENAELGVDAVPEAEKAVEAERDFRVVDSVSELAAGPASGPALEPVSDSESESEPAVGMGLDAAVEVEPAMESDADSLRDIASSESAFGVVGMPVQEGSGGVAIHGKDDVGGVVLTGALSVVNCMEVKYVFLRAMELFSTVKCDFSGVQETDISIIQLVCAAFCTAEQKGIPIMCDQRPSQEFELTVLRAGLDKTIDKEKWSGAFWGRTA